MTLDNLHNLYDTARDFRAKKRLGQNFLINPEVLDQISAALQIGAGDHVLEIGPGLGFLTALLVSAGADVTAVELDPDCVASLTDLKLSRLKIIHEDFLRADLDALLTQNIKVIGNIPYNITTPIVAKLLGELDAPSPWLTKIDAIVLTVQREVGLRLVAKAGDQDYSQISVLVGLHAEGEMLFDISPENFSPAPAVTSCVVRLKPRKASPISCRNMRLFSQVVKAGFRQRRKMLRNNLAFLKLDREIVSRAFDRLNFDPQVRAERLGLKEFAALTNELDECLRLSPQQS